MNHQIRFSVGVLGLCLALFAGHAVAAEVAPNVYAGQKLKDLGYGGSVTYDINEQGVTSGTVVDNLSDIVQQPAIWDVDGNATNVARDTSSYGFGLGLNNLNHLVGDLHGPSLFADGQVYDLQSSVPQGYASKANDIDEAGVIYGCESIPVSADATTYFTSPALWRDKVTAEPIPGTPAGTTGCAYAVNALGHATGTATLDNLLRAVIWRDGQLFALGIPAGYSSCTGYGINDAGQVAGACINAASGGARPFLWRDTEVLDLGTVSGDTGVATDINNAGEVVGYAPLPFVWRDGIQYDLVPVMGNGLVNGAHVGINNAGQIVTHSYRLTPAPGAFDLAAQTLSYAYPSGTVGTPLTFTGTLLNLSGSTATGVTATDTLPSGLKLDSVSISQGSCTTANPIICTVGNLPSGGNVQLTIVATPQVAGTLSHQIAVGSAETDVNPLNDQAAFSVTVSGAAQADLGVSITGSPNPAKKGQSLRYTVVASNINFGTTTSGASTATNVQLSYNLPGKVTLQSVTPSQGQCSVNASTVNCQFGDVALSKNATVDILVTPTAKGTLTSSATVKSDLPDPNQDNNSATSSIKVR